LDFCFLFILNNNIVYERKNIFQDCLDKKYKYIQIQLLKFNNLWSNFERIYCI